MKRQPMLYRVDELMKWDTMTWDMMRNISTGRWVAARPYGHNAYPFWWRWYLAWRVLVGSADVVTWEGEKSENKR